MYISLASLDLRSMLREEVQCEYLFCSVWCKVLFFPMNATHVSLSTRFATTKQAPSNVALSDYSSGCHGQQVIMQQFCIILNMTPPVGMWLIYKHKA